jgi:RNA 2',3'-cyclic 3'-phosphodiesterase
MSLIRAFIAIEIPPKILTTITQVTSQIRATLGPSIVRWVPPEKMHLTVKFLGDVSQANVELVAEMLAAEARQQAAFEILVEGFGAFPDSRHPRVLWVGIQAPDELGALQRGIETGAARLGYPGENRPFSPHLTIGRVKQNVHGEALGSIRTAIESAHIGLLGKAQITSLDIFKSELKSSGAVYTKLFSAPLGVGNS